MDHKAYLVSAGCERNVTPCVPADAFHHVIGRDRKRYVHPTAQNIVVADRVGCLR